MPVSETMETFVALGLIAAVIVATTGMGIAAAWVQRDRKHPR